MNVRIKRLRPLAKVPQYMSRGAAGCDVFACPEEERLSVGSLERVTVGTGIAVEVPEGYEIQVRPRSGLAIKQGLTVVNSPGTVDSDFRGELKVLMVNLGKDRVIIETGDRIAQLILSPVHRMNWEESDSLSLSSRGEGGFGSTGKY